MHGALKFKLYCDSQLKPDISRGRALRESVSVHFVTEGEGAELGHSVTSACEAQEHHIIQRTVELWNDLGYNGQPTWFILKFKSGARTDQVTQEIAQMSVKPLQ